MPYPLPLTRTEAYLAYKAGVIQQSDLKPSLAVPRNGIDAWLAYWTGLAADYPKREDGTPHILQEEEAYIAYLCGVINEYPEKCLRRVGAYLRYIISARWGRPDHPLNREELYLSLIKTQFIPSGDPSSDIVINGTAKAPFVDVKMYGDTFQQSYEGKNLINPSAISGTDNGITYSFDQATNEITLNGTATGKSTCYFSNENRISLDGKYTLSYEKVSGSITPSDTCRIEVAASSWGSNTIYLNLQDSSASVTATKTFDVYAVDFNIGQGTVCNNFKVKLQLEKSASATSYEPYVGRQASPNPDYPQPIQTVTGEQMVTVASKNLFSGQNLTEDSRVSTSNGVTYDRDGYEVSDYIEVEPSTNYALTCGNTQNGSYFSWYDSTKTYISGSGWQNKTVKTSPANASYIRFDFLASEVGIVQFEKGSVSSYVPYSNVSYPISLGSIELCKLGTYQDYIYKDGDSWKVHKAVAKHALKPNEGWIIPNPASYPNLFQTNAIRDLGNLSDAYTTASTSPQAYCEALVYLPGSGDIRTTQGFSLFHTVEGGAAYNIARINIAGFTTTTQLNNWLSTCNANFWYGVKIPTDTVITDQTLIAQLKALKNGGAENGTTYIKVNAADPNLPGLLYVEAPKYE